MRYKPLKLLPSSMLPNLALRVWASVAPLDAEASAAAAGDTVAQQSYMEPSDHAQETEAAAEGRCCPSPAAAGTIAAEAIPLVTGTERTAAAGS